MVIKEFIKELRVKNIALNYEDSDFGETKKEIIDRFSQSMWSSINGLPYLIYRYFIAIYYTIWFVESIVRNYEFRAKNYMIRNKNGTLALQIHPWPFYMTSWSLTVLLFHLWTCAIIVTYFFNFDESALGSLKKKLFRTEHHRAENSVVYQPTTIATTCDYDKCNISDTKDIEDGLKLKEDLSGSDLQSYSGQRNQHNHESNTFHLPFIMRIFIRFSWLSYNLISIAAIVVTVSYFSYVYVTELQVEPNIITEIGNMHRHGINSLVTIVDVIILAYPVRIYHSFYTMLYGWMYTLVAFLYWLPDKENHVIYVTMDFNKPMLTLIGCIFLSSVTVFLQFIHYLVYRLKLYIRDRVCEN